MVWCSRPRQRSELNRSQFHRPPGPGGPGYDLEMARPFAPFPVPKASALWRRCSLFRRSIRFLGSSPLRPPPMRMHIGRTVPGNSYRRLAIWKSRHVNLLLRSQLPGLHTFLLFGMRIDKIFSTGRKVRVIIYASRFPAQWQLFGSGPFQWIK